MIIRFFNLDIYKLYFVTRYIGVHEYELTKREHDSHKLLSRRVWWRALQPRVMLKVQVEPLFTELGHNLELEMYFELIPWDTLQNIYIYLQQAHLC